MVQAGSDALVAGREAIDRHDWRSAYSLLKDAVETEASTVRDLESLGDAAWWTAHLEEAIAAKERAFSMHLADGNKRKAARIAISVAKDYFSKGGSSIGMGWVKQSERLLKDDDCIERGYLKRMHAVMAQEGTHDFEDALRRATEALEIATEYQDKDLMAMAVHDQGRALVSLGKVEEGWALIEEGAIAAVGEELSPLITASIYCNTITVCKELADYQRAGEWSEAASRWCERQSIAGFPGMCRVYRSHVMLMKGAWSEAEKEARQAFEELKGFNLEYAAAAFYEIGIVRLRMGDGGSAEEAFRQAHQLGRDPQPGLALLRMRQGRPEAAVKGLERALSETDIDLAKAPLLGALVEALLTTGQTDRSREVAEELSRIARTYGTDALEAESACATGLVALGQGDLERAQSSLRSGLRLWMQVSAPYEAARARVHLAEAHERAGDEDSAAMELRTARASFEELGAVAEITALSDREGGEEALPTRASRGTWTFMFTDIVGSTDLVEAIGDDAWNDLVRWHDRMLRGLFSSHGGTEIDHAGDGFFVSFGNARGAVDCGAEIQKGLQAHRRDHGFAPQVRIGVHKAEAIHGGGGYKGKGVHAAARIAAEAEAGEILISAETVHGVPQRFALSDPRSVRLKGMKEPVEVLSLKWR